MATSPKRAGGGKTARVPLTKAKLLPMNAALASDRSLTYHVALDGWRRGHGNRRIVNELTRATYMAWFLQCAGYGDAPVELFKAAECVGELTLMKAHGSGETDGWSLDAESVSIFTDVLGLHDAQLRSAPLHQYESAERRLLAFLHGPERSLFPILGAKQKRRSLVARRSQPIVTASGRYGYRPNRHQFERFARPDLRGYQSIYPESLPACSQTEADPI